MEPARKPRSYVIAGPNGAGKPTFATEFLPGFAECREFVNADLIAADLSPFAPETQAIRAGKLLLARIKELSEAGQDFAFETTLAGRSYAALLNNLRKLGYDIELFFLWLPSADLAVRRVANRVRQGGHSVPEQTVRRRYVAGLRNLFAIYRPLIDSFRLLDASHLPPRLIVRELGGRQEVLLPLLYESISRTWKGDQDE